jgi:thiamine biosynthesis lipoprotein
VNARMRSCSSACSKNRLIGGVLIVTLVVLVGVGLWKTSGRRAADRIAVVRQCRAVMGTDCTLAAVVLRGGEGQAEDVLQEAEAVLRAAEARMSSWLKDSEIGRLGAAEAGQEVPLSPDTIEVLRIARRACQQTAGVFDVTCRPVVELWREAGKRGEVPSPSELAAARTASSWELIELTDRGAVKGRTTARVDLGGIAKGWAIDRAAEVLRRAGLSGGMVDVGGDLVCFGEPPEEGHGRGSSWPVDVQNPLGPGYMAKLRLSGGAVCTSGGYARFTEIAGRRYSHIIDPRSGLPAEAALSVTVVAADAVTADIWATALSVLGREGLKRLPDGVEAMLMVGTKDDHQIVCTASLRGMLDEKR